MNTPHPAEPPFPPEVLLRAQGGERGIRAALFDVDGVLTDGRLYIGEHGEAFKAFHVLDGHGLKLLAQGGIEPVIITGRDSAAVRRRVADLGLARAWFGVADKLAVAPPPSARLRPGASEPSSSGDGWCSGPRPR